MIVLPPNCRSELAAVLSALYSAGAAPAPEPWLQPWVDRLAGDSPRQTVLPRREGDRIVWYGLAFDDRQFQELGDDLLAFIGPAFSTFRGRRFEPREHQTDCLLGAATGGRVFAFEAGTVAEPELRAALDRLLVSWTARPAVLAGGVQHVSRLTRAFDMAVLAGNRADAEEALDRLRTSGQLSAENLLFLQVRLESALGGSERVLTLDELPDLLRVRRPPDVTAALISAVYAHELSRFETEDDPAGAARHFVDVVVPRYGALYANRIGLTDPAVLKSFMLVAATNTPPRPELRDELLQFTNIPPVDYLYLERLAGLLAHPVPTAPIPLPPVDCLMAARTAVEEDDFDRAFALATTLPDGIEKARLLCRCAYEVGTLESRSAAAVAVASLGEHDRSRLLATRAAREMWAAIQLTDAPSSANPPPAEPIPVESATVPVPRNWLEWFDLLADPAEWNRARQFARQGATEWAIESLTSNPMAPSALAERLRIPPSNSLEVVCDCLPHLLAFLRRIGPPAPEYGPIYRAALEVLYLAGTRRSAELAVFTETLDAVLTLGPKRDEYGELVGYALEMWRTDRAPALLGWLTDLTDILVYRPAADVAVRRQVIEELLTACARSVHRLGVEELELVRQLATEVGEGGQADELLPARPTAATGDPMADLASMSVAIHTLTEGAAQAASNVLNRKYPGVKVTLLHDFVCSKRLQQYARQANLFVMVTWSTKHAATDCIETHRPEGAPLLRPDGKGSSSILRAIRTHLGG